MSLMSEARDILGPLVQGVDPRTGEVLAKDHLCSDPQINRALVIATTLLEHECTHQPPRTGSDAQERDSSHQYTPWTEIEDNALRAEFATHLRVREMAIIHHRTRGAIRSRLQRLDLI